MSKLIVEVCRIEELKPHTNAEKLELAIVKGWQCIVGKGNHTLGELVIFCPPDSIIPDNLIERYKLEFLKKNGKVGTIKLRGEVSQGLILECKNDNVFEGQDVAKDLGITKWEPPERPVQGGKPTIKEYWTKYRAKEITLRRFVRKSAGLIYDAYFKYHKKRNPEFTEYTDIDHMKNFPEVFQEGDMVYISEKIHGSNWRAANLPRANDRFYRRWLNKFRPTYEFVYGSHTVQKDAHSSGWYDSDIWAEMVKKYNIDKILPPDYTLYGEVYGCKVQDLVYDCPNERKLVLFDVKYKGEYLSYQEFKQFCEQYNLPTVPVLFVGRFSKATMDLYTNGKSLICPTQIREGCVVKAVIEEHHPKIGRKVLKSVSVDYLTRKGGTEFH